jgi:hypothetical protein
VVCAEVVLMAQPAAEMVSDLGGDGSSVDGKDIIVAI